MFLYFYNDCRIIKRILLLCFMLLLHVIHQRNVRALIQVAVPRIQKNTFTSPITNKVFAPYVQRNNNIRWNSNNRFFSVISSSSSENESKNNQNDENIIDSVAIQSSNIKSSSTIKTKNKNHKPKKGFTVVDSPSKSQEKNLAAAFDQLAMKDGFDSSMSFYAEDDTFEDDFDDDFDDDDIEFDNDDTSIRTDMNDDNDDNADDDMGDSMDDRIASAQIDASKGRVRVPDTLDKYANKLTSIDLKKLGYRRENNPYGNDETPRREKFVINIDPMICPGCGSDFQSTNEQKPGYLPPDKFEIQVKLKELEVLRNLREKDSDEQITDWTPEDEIEYLIRTAGQSSSNSNGKKDSDTTTMNIEAIEEELGMNTIDYTNNKKIICKRCHSLVNHGTVDILLRPGWSKEPLLSQENFRNLLRPLSMKNCVIIALVDIFDFSGSVLTELDSIAGYNNPVIIAANKVDLLPNKMGPTRIENWIRKELSHLGIECLSNKKGGFVRLVSCKTGVGVEAMLEKARKLAEEIDGDIYIIGAANSGKSTLMNRIISRNEEKSSNNNDKTILPKLRPGNINKIKDTVTTSPLPGTTLKFISANIGDGRTLYDTPGLLVPGTLTQLLTPEELKIVVPSQQVEPVTFRVSNGKCVMIGGLAKIELIGDSKPFLFTFFVANAIKLHPTDSLKANDFLQKHIGTMLTPPLEPGLQRYNELLPFEEHILDIEGTGWKEACADIALTGLGWISVMGAGTANVKITVPQGLGVEVRPPLMPFDVWESTAKYTGSRSVRKSSKTSAGKRRKGVGRS